MTGQSLSSTAIARFAPAGQQFLLRHDRAARYRLLFGPITVALALVVADGRLVLVPCGWAFLGLPMPLRWTPGGNASEYAKDDRFWFDVELGIR